MAEQLDTLTLPVLPLSTGVVLPQMVVTLALETEEAKVAAAAAETAEGRLLLVPKFDSGRYATVGTLATIENRGTLPSGDPALVVRATGRAHVGTGVIGQTAALWVQADPVVDDPAAVDPDDAATLKAAINALFEELGGRRLTAMLGGVDDPGALADLAGWWPELSFDRKVELLETTDAAHRVAKVTGWAKEALAELQLTKRIRDEVSEGMERSQREYLLRQQMAAIQKELGEDDEDDLADGFRAQLAELVEAGALPEPAVTHIGREIDRFERTPAQNTEHGWIRSWLEAVFEVPWTTRTADDLDLARARAVLDADHTGLEEVKERIVEFLAVRKLRAERTADLAPSAGPAAGLSDLSGGDAAEPDDAAEADEVGIDPTIPVLGTGPAAAAPRRGDGAIITLLGPPGVGKTSLGESIARALGRRFVRVALGGVRDESEIRGHRRTYVGAQAGRIVRAITESGSMNPVVLLDEIDKVGSDWRGDPSAALLEVLDPAQNHNFRDHYLELDLDLSDVIFIATANEYSIPGPLLDRMEVITLDGYTEAEKVAIARDHLVARQRDRSGLRPAEVTITDEALADIVASYTREAGVRNLERLVGKVLRKTATQVATGTATPIVVDVDQVPDLLGRRRFVPESADTAAVAGLATGLAVTGAGGDVLYVEATAMPGDSGLVVTGQLGDVMKESAQIALSYVRSRAEDLGIDPAAFEGRRFHVHFPAGAIPKDGPSAGITMTTALVSLLTGRVVKPTVAMTGEVTLQGRVLPIGGVKQKVLAAHRAGITDVIVPLRNEGDLDDVPESVRSTMRFHALDDVADVLEVALGDLLADRPGAGPAAQPSSPAVGPAPASAA